MTTGYFFFLQKANIKMPKRYILADKQSKSMQNNRLGCSLQSDIVIFLFNTEENVWMRCA